ncbi:P-loop containing nucleoside triphosphate hydrolase protein [Boletus reticuloceps]|uniref:P-loop containing nucleoside triphosphate hydrolase protein n=1 Tax=Boletus reticuloceps TaxID=495285 RepID=A0A8I2YH08_9AGAM|nr:P-loop containing nucleoside triphosphate hydrolase protein [Boletus reticuloceps]
MGVVGAWIGRIYMKAQLSAKREMSNAKAPVLGHLGAAMADLTSIRAYGAEDAMVRESLARIDEYTRSARMVYNLNSWVSVRVDALGALFAAALAAYLVYGPERHRAANIGLSLTMAVAFSFCGGQQSVDSYIKIEQEPKPNESGIPTACWPASGDLRVENLSARYSPNGPEVLHGLSFHIKSGERVGIVGRTGSGKSSLTLSLLRCIPTEGRVYLDGMLTSEIDLDASRSRVTIIPQIPEFLSGTLRRNLDPFEEHDDATLSSSSILRDCFLCKKTRKRVGHA